jgi:hypothetical protein
MRNQSRRLGQDLEIRQVSQTECCTLALREDEGPQESEIPGE